MKAGFSFALLRDSQPPAGGLRCLALGFFPNVIFRRHGSLGKAHGIYNFLCLLYLKAPGKKCTLTVRLKLFCLQVSFYLGYGVSKMTETVLFPGKAAL